jgi:hypothetical protein
LVTAQAAGYAWKIAPGSDTLNPVSASQTENQFWQLVSGISTVETACTLGLELRKVLRESRTAKCALRTIVDIALGVT